MDSASGGQVQPTVYGEDLDVYSSVFVVVGAGAGSDISTQLITDDLLDWNGIAAPQAGLPRAVSTELPFFQWLLEASRSAYPARDATDPYGYYPRIGSPNFEELIHLVERLSYLINERYYDSLYRRPPPYEADFYRLSELGEFLKANRYSSLYDTVMLASNHILDFVAARADERPRVEAGDVIEAIGRKRALKIFSLNYDTRIVQNGDGYWTGFSRMTDSEAKQCNAKNNGREIFRLEPSIPERERAFIQMHGSTHFGWIEDYIPPRYKIARYPKPLIRHGTPRRDGFELWGDRSVLPALTMITGFRKGEKTLIEPYLSYLHYFRAEAYRTPYWIVMGYGGADPHVNAIMRSASDHWGDQLRAFVFSHVKNEPPSSASSPIDLKRRFAYLGRNARNVLGALDDPGVVSTSTVLLTTDGQYGKHIDRLIEFIS